MSSSKKSRNFCGQTIQEQEFILQSPNYPRNYANDLDCYIRILPYDIEVCSLELRFDEFRLDTSISTDPNLCPNDFLQISDIDKSGEPQIYCDVFSGTVTPKLISPLRSRLFPEH